MSEWMEISIGKYCKIQGGFAFKSNDFIEKGVPVAKIKNVKERDIDLTDCGFVDENLANSNSDYFVKKGDVLISMTGSGMNAPNSIVGRVARHIGSDNAFLINQRVGRFLIKDETQLDKHFLFHYLSPKERQLELVSIATGSANQVNISGKQIESLKINLPSLPEQKTIAHILGTLDEKIALNRQMNQTLEAMAQALFKSWFVDFDPVMDNALAVGNEIPDELQAMAEKRSLVPEKQKLLSKNPDLAGKFPSSFVFNETLEKWIPEGWKVKSLNKIIKLIGGGTPKTSNGEYWNGNIPWFSVVDAPNDSDVFVINTEKKVSEEGVKNSSTQILREGTTIISARGTVGKCAIVGVPMAMNQSCYGIQSLNENEDIFTYLLVRKNVSDLQNKSHGSVFSTITRDTFNAIDVVVPQRGKVINVFESTLKYNFEKIKSNLFEIRTLTQLRDRLLPELISGKVRVKDKIIK